MIDLDLLALELENAASWRFEKSIDWPDDDRNAKAAVLLERLANEVRGLNGSPLHRKLKGVLEKDVDYSFALEEENEYRQQIGFHTFPTSGSAYLESLLVIYENHSETTVLEY